MRGPSEHGFLNLLAAAVFADEEEILADDDVESFSVDDESFSWRDRSATSSQISHARRDLVHAVGSCSFFEPVDELISMKVLPA